MRDAVVRAPSAGGRGGGLTKVERGLCNCYETPFKMAAAFRTSAKKTENFYIYTHSFVDRFFFYYCFLSPLLPRTNGGGTGCIFLIILGPPRCRAACNDLQIIFESIPYYIFRIPSDI